MVNVSVLKCFLKLKMSPYSCAVIFALILVAYSYQLGKLLYAKRLERKYWHKCFKLESKRDRESYANADKVLREISHVNVIRLHASFITWIPFVKRVGHFFVEKIDVSVSDAWSQGIVRDPLFNITDICQHL